MAITGGKLFPYVWQWSHLDRIQVTGVFGWPAVPLAVKQAALIAAAVTALPAYVARARAARMAGASRWRQRATTCWSGRISQALPGLAS